jgi:hypothetical protein
LEQFTTHSKKDNQATRLLKEVGGTVRNALGSTDSDNAGDLGSKITTGLQNQLKNKAINTTEGLINDKANQFFNQFGSGRSEISIHQITSESPTYSLKTIQPLSELNDKSKDLTFFQGQLASGENYGERRNTINLGIGQRWLLEAGQSMVGLNVFADYEIESKQKRASLGLEYKRVNFSAYINSYHPLSDKIVMGDYTEEPLAGYDIKFTGQVPYLPWATLKATRYFWDKTNTADSSNIKGTILGMAIKLTPSIEVELGTETSNTADRASHLRLTTQLPFKDHESLINFSLDSTPFRNAGIVNLTDLSRVERSNKIRIEKLDSGGQRVLGVYNATTRGASCILYNASGVAVSSVSDTGTTLADGTVDLSNIKLPTTPSLYFSRCIGGSYTDEATGQTVNPAPTLHGAMMYSGRGDLTIIASVMV